ncbi:hypothetical protein P4C99_14020 [Pontiellaceae bacterium B1224]|nr:hypothetical protein [Pontiellaceae bacterium B1224]
MDSLLSTVQIPKGVPVAIGKPKSGNDNEGNGILSNDTGIKPKSHFTPTGFAFLFPSFSPFGWPISPHPLRF